MQIYADNAATTKMSETALNAMLPFLREYYGNPSSGAKGGGCAGQFPQCDSRMLRLLPQGDLFHLRRQ